MKIYDVFLFGFELDLLEIRLNLLNPYVDYFVFCESELTFSGIHKEFYYLINQDKFKKFHDKIIYNKIPNPTKQQLDEISKKYNIKDFPSFQRDVYQKNSIKNILEKYCKDDDIILWGDLDEIPNPEVLSQLKTFYDQNTVYNFAQDNYLGYLNWFESSSTIFSQTLDFNYDKEGPRWIGTKMMNFSILKKYSLTEIRKPLNNENNFRIYPGGWHWSGVGSPYEQTAEKRILWKIKTSAHREVFDDENIQKTINEQILKNKSPIGQHNASYSTLKFNSDNFPKYLIENQKKYSYLIKK